MRKVTKEAYDSFINRKRFNSSNTEVRIIEGEAHMFLFGNKIARTENHDTFICSGNYPAARTTKERLDPFTNFKLRIIKGEFILDNRRLWTGEWLNINNI